MSRAIGSSAISRSGRPGTPVDSRQAPIAARLIAIQIQGYLHAVGIDAQLKGYTTQLMFGAYAAGGVYQAGRFDLAWYTI